MTVDREQVYEALNRSYLDHPTDTTGVFDAMTDAVMALLADVDTGLREQLAAQRDYFEALRATDVALLERSQEEAQAEITRLLDRTSCPWVETSDEGTSFCRLAETAPPKVLWTGDLGDLCSVDGANPVDGSYSEAAGVNAGTRVVVIEAEAALTDSEADHG